MTSPLHSPTLRFHVDSIFLKEVKKVPRHVPISEWHNRAVRLLNVKRGISRHVVLFVKAGRFSFGPGKVSSKETTLDWYQNIYVPACELFRIEGIVDIFPGKTASKLYIEIMTNKYYMNEHLGKDVGKFNAMKNYVENLEWRLRSST